MWLVSTTDLIGLKFILKPGFVFVPNTEYQLSVSGQREEIDFIVIKQHAVLVLP